MLVDFCIIWRANESFRSCRRIQLHLVVFLAVLASLSLCSDAIGQWTTSQLSASRGNVASTSLPTKALAFFAGGSSPSGNPFPHPISSNCSRVVDIFNGLTRTWSTAQLSAARERLAASRHPFPVKALSCLLADQITIVLVCLAVLHAMESPFVVCTASCFTLSHIHCFL